MNQLADRILSAPDRTPAPLLLVRFVSPDKLGVGRFVKIGIPSPEVLAPFVGVV